jgi:hypothetical protein
MPGSALAAFFLSGFAALLYQIVWQRMLGIFSGADVQSATMASGVGTSTRTCIRGTNSTSPRSSAAPSSASPRGDHAIF